MERTGRAGLGAAILAWLPIVVAVSGVCFFTMVAVQQSYRQGANDPQIQLAEDAAARLTAGEAPKSVVGSGQVDVAASLAPWVVVYGADKAPVAWSGVLDGKAARPPVGVLDAAAVSGRNAVSWQPRPEVRAAIVAVPVKGGAGGFVVAGRSLREVEVRESLIYQMGLAAWAVTMLATLVAAWAATRFGGRAIA
ncbi:MAG TPA: hypothetical protein VF902_10500 [Coriobacteriia bacterium]